MNNYFIIYKEYNQKGISISHLEDKREREREETLGMRYKFVYIARHSPQQDYQGKVYIKKRIRIRTNPWAFCNYSLAVKRVKGEERKKEWIEI